jgi:hypothetical protein
MVQAEQKQDVFLLDGIATLCLNIVPHSPLFSLSNRVIIEVYELDKKPLKRIARILRLFQDVCTCMKGRVMIALRFPMLSTPSDEWCETLAVILLTSRYGIK